jgi:acyl-coenzyme A synthetase/AMP-(fatty) acid ligase/acyl carrier protein
MDRELGADPGVWLAVTSISFDISVLELFWTLARGFKVVIQPGGSSTLAAVEGTTVPEQIKRHGVTHFQCTPSLLKGLLADPHTAPALGSLKRLLLGGEALPIALAKQVHGLNPQGFFNMYGPTETTVWSTVQKIDRVPDAISIGHPIANTQAHILDEKLQPVPQGAEGEILIGGEGVARGYLNRPELTAERFVPDPFQAGTGNRLYRTGDLGRWLPDGTLQCIGRIDNQVKIRGQRIELGEIEAALHRCPGVQEAVVVAREDQLAAYIIPVTGTRPVTEDLRASLKQVLSEAMIPSAFILLERFPLTPNGKIDRKALPSLKAEVSTSPPASPLSGSQMEQQIIQIWAELLGVDASTIGLHQNFFDLGGHSLLVVQMQTRLREKFGADLPLAQLFQYTTPSSLAAHLGGGSAATTSAALNRGQMKKKGFRQQARAKAEVTV